MAAESSSSANGELSEAIAAVPGDNGGGDEATTDRLRRRLADLGASDFRFIPHGDAAGRVVEAKTLIWEAVRVRRRRSRRHRHRGNSSISLSASNGGEEEKKQDDGRNTREEKEEWEEIVDHRFAVVLREDDCVDGLRLRDLVRREMIQTATAADKGVGVDPALPVREDHERLVVRLAPADAAEELTGCESGTMPPIGHASPLSALYLDEGMTAPLEPASLANDGVNDEAGLSSDSVVVSLGSGCRQHALHIAWEELVRIGERETRRPVVVKPLSRSSTSSLSSSSFSEDRGSSASARCEPRKNARAKVRERRSSSAPAAERAAAALFTFRSQNVTTRAQLLRTTAKKPGRAADVRCLLDEAGASFPQLMDCAPGGPVDKNALHLAAWKGDLETIALLLEAGSAHGVPDLVNTVSTGSGNHGKTPIFYALTQCRDDAVLYLCSVGADLLVVNNKGQTPVSLAASHLKSNTCEVLCSIEASQLKEGRSFVNYRATHSDGRRYGDLDPRFDIDDVTMDDELAAELELYRSLVRNSTSGSVGEGSAPDLWDANIDDRLRSLAAIEGLPRSVRRTVRHWQVDRDNGSSFIKVVRPPKNDAAQQRRSSDVRSGHTKSGDSPKPSPGEDGDRRNSLSPAKAQSKRSELPKADTVESDSSAVSALEVLTFEHLDTMTARRPTNIRVVESLEDIVIFADAVRESVETVGRAASSDDENLVAAAWGLDCEWKPSNSGHGADNPVATLQLASASGGAFLIDVQRLCQKDVVSPDQPMNPTETALSAALSGLFLHCDLPILGFGVGQDLGKLAASFPHLSGFRLVHNVIDLHTVLSRLRGREKAEEDGAHCFQQIGSLQKAVAVLLERKLDKSEQCSNWETRPLTRSQVRYAVLDAAVLPMLLQRILERREEDGYSLRLQPLSHRFAYLSPRNDLDVKIDESAPKSEHTMYSVPSGRVNNLLSIQMARQQWPTGSASPDPPSCLRPRHQKKPLSQNYDREGSDEAQLDPSPTRRRSRRRKTLPLKEAPGFFDGLPRPGTILGYTKDSCVHRVLGHRFVDALPDDVRLGFNRRGGVLRASNGWLLFANFGGQASYGRYRNAFSEGGRQMTFSLNMGRDEDHSLLDYMSIRNIDSSEESSTSRSLQDDSDRNVAQKVVLFMRPSLQQKFMFCGECTCARLNLAEDGENDDFLDLLLTLRDYKQLVVEGDFARYRDLIRSKEAEACT